MEKYYGTYELNYDEMKTIDGGFVLSIIALFFPKPKIYTDFIEGYKEGYEATSIDK